MICGGRFLVWLREVFAQSEDSTPDWLSEWLSNVSISADTAEVIFVVMTLLLVLMVIAFILNEVRIARRRRSTYAMEADSMTEGLWPGAVDRSISLEELDDWPARKQIPALFVLALRHLVAQQDLPNDASLTTRQVTARLQRDDLRPHFSRLANAAERVLFGGRSPTNDELAARRQDLESIIGARDERPA